MRGSILRDALQLARRAERRVLGLPAPRRMGSTGIARRHVLAMLGTGAAAMAAPPVLAQPVPAKSAPPRVAIVGGGLAGLNALSVLTEAGVDAHLYEARPRLGGRILTLRDATAPETWEDLGGQLVNSDHEDMIGLARRFGIRLIDRRALGGHELVVRNQRRVVTTRLARELAPLASQIARDSAALDASGAAALARLDRMSVADYLHRHRKLVTSRTVLGLLEQTIRTEFGVEPHEASAVELIFNLPTVHGQAFETLGASDERFVIEGGSGRIVEALAEKFASRISTGRQLAAITRAGLQVRLQFADGTAVTVDRLILAVPPALMGEIDHGGLFPTPWQALARELRLGNNEKLNAAYSARVWARSMGAAGSLWDASDNARFAEVWDCSAGQKGTAGMLTWFLGGDQTKTLGDGLREQIEAAVGGALGDLAGASLDRTHATHWGQEPFTRGAYVNFAKGQFLRFGGLTWLEEGGRVTRAARSGPVLLAGEHLSDAWPGYMNGAAQTGRLAAKAVLEHVL